MKVKLLKKLRKRFKFKIYNGSKVLLDLKNKEIVRDVFYDFRLSGKKNLLNHALKQIISKKEIDKYKRTHELRAYCNAKQRAFNEAMKV